jgi:hypothetical protein
VGLELDRRLLVGLRQVSVVGDARPRGPLVGEEFPISELVDDRLDCGFSFNSSVLAR